MVRERWHTVWPLLKLCQPVRFVKTDLGIANPAALSGTRYRRGATLWAATPSSIPVPDTQFQMVAYSEREAETSNSKDSQLLVLPNAKAALATSLFITASNLLRMNPLRAGVLGSNHNTATERIIVKDYSWNSSWNTSSCIFEIR